MDVPVFSATVKPSKMKTIKEKSRKIAFFPRVIFYGFL